MKGTHHGNDVDVERVGSLDACYEKSIIYIEKKKYLDIALSRKPAAIVIPYGLACDDIPCVEVEDPKLAFISLLKIFAPRGTEYSGLHSAAIISEKASIGDNVAIMQGAVVMEGVRIDDGSIIYPNCVIERDVEIGAGTVIFSGSVIKERCIIGNGCIIHSGVVIGTDGFGYYEKHGQIIKIPHIGIVKIGDRVEIGANTCVDRATVDVTEIGNDTKIDNMVYIAHNCRIGERCYIAAMSALAGSVNVGNHVVILGQVGIADHLTVGDDSIIVSQSGIAANVGKGEALMGSPARPLKEHHRIYAALGHLPGLLKRVKRIEDIIKGE